MNPNLPSRIAILYCLHCRLPPRRHARRPPLPLPERGVPQQPAPPLLVLPQTPLLALSPPPPQSLPGQATLCCRLAMAPPPRPSPSRVRRRHCKPHWTSRGMRLPRRMVGAGRGEAEGGTEGAGTAEAEGWRRTGSEDVFGSVGARGLGVICGEEGDGLVRYAGGGGSCRSCSLTFSPRQSMPNPAPPSHVQSLPPTASTASRPTC